MRELNELHEWVERQRRNLRKIAELGAAQAKKDAALKTENRDAGDSSERKDYPERK
jgi:hypothetical protein